MPWPKGRPQPVKERTCACGASFIGHANKKYCDPCRRETNRILSLKGYYTNRRPLGEPKPGQCEGCSSSILINNGRRFCDGCWAERRRGISARYRLKQKEAGAPRPYLREQHGITEEDLRFMVITQGGRCAGCGRIPPIAGKQLHVDHNHSTCHPQGGRSCERCRRGLLCAECNMLLGLARDNPATLQSLIGYLGRWG